MALVLVSMSLNKQLPAVVAFMLVPDWRRRWLLSPYPWAAAVVAVVDVKGGEGGAADDKASAEQTPTLPF